MNGTYTYLQNASNGASMQIGSINQHQQIHTQRHVCIWTIVRGIQCIVDCMEHHPGAITI